MTELWGNFFDTIQLHARRARKSIMAVTYVGLSRSLLLRECVSNSGKHYQSIFESSCRYIATAWRGVGFYSLTCDEPWKSKLENARKAVVGILDFEAAPAKSLGKRQLSSSLFSLSPNEGFILKKKIVRQQLHIFRSILHVTPLALLARSEIPVTVGPPAHRLKWF